MRLNLLKLLRSVVEVHPNRTLLVERYGLLDVVESLSKTDGAVLVRELAREIVPTLRPVLMKSSAIGAGASSSGGGGSNGHGHVAPAVHRLKARAESVDRSIRGISSVFSPPTTTERGEQHARERDRDQHRDREPPKERVFFERENSPGLRSSISSGGGVVPKLKPREKRDRDREHYRRVTTGEGEDIINGTELRERERVILVSRKTRRAASEASASPGSSFRFPPPGAPAYPQTPVHINGNVNGSGTNGVRRPTLPNSSLGPSSEKFGIGIGNGHPTPGRPEPRRLISGFGSGLGSFSSESSTNGGGSRASSQPPSSAMSPSSIPVAVQTSGGSRRDGPSGLSSPFSPSFNSAFSGSLSSSQFKSRLPRQKLDDVAAWLDRDTD